MIALSMASSAGRLRGSVTGPWCPAGRGKARNSWSGAADPTSPV